jgi:hypothetical protein
MLVALLRFHAPGDSDGPGARPPLRVADVVGPAAGFLGAECLSDAKAPQLIYLATRWTDLRAFQRWHTGKTRRQPQSVASAPIPDQPILDRGFRLVLFVDRLAHPRGIVDPDTLALYLPELVGRFVAESQSVHFIAVADSGAVLACNSAVTLTLALPASKILGQQLSRFVADPPALRRWSTRGTLADERLRLDLLDTRGASTALDCRAVARSDGLVILGEPVRDEDRHLQSEFLGLENRLAIMARENVRKGKALRRIHTRLRATLEGMKSARALWEATAMFEATLRDLERSIRRLERTDETAVGGRADKQPGG